jgi:hypothetical protein
MWNAWGRRSAYKVLVRRRDGNRPLGRPTRRWKDNIKIDLQEVGRGDADRIALAQDKDRWRTMANAVMNLRVP